MFADNSIPIFGKVLTYFWRVKVWMKRLIYSAILLFFVTVTIPCYWCGCDCLKMGCRQHVSLNGSYTFLETSQFLVRVSSVVLFKRPCPSIDKTSIHMVVYLSMHAMVWRNRNSCMKWSHFPQKCPPLRLSFEELFITVVFIYTYRRNICLNKLFEQLHYLDSGSYVCRRAWVVFSRTVLLRDGSEQDYRTFGTRHVCQLCSPSCRPSGWRYLHCRSQLFWLVYIWRQMGTGKLRAAWRTDEGCVFLDFSIDLVM